MVKRTPLSPDLDLCVSREYGTVFETGRPVRFRFVRNTEKSPYMGERFGQDVEPRGRYLLHNPDPGDLPRKWEAGEVEFQKPLVLKMVSGGRDEPIYGPQGWKARLSRSFGGRKGKWLSCHLRKLGYDGIVTCDGDAYTREIVDLRVVECP